MAQLTTRESDLSTWNPMMELREMSNRMNQLFRSTLGREGILSPSGEALTTLASWSPTVNVSETESEYHITAELAGVDKKDLHVKTQNGVISIEGERKQAKEEKGETFHRVERFYGSFARRFSLPEDADSSKIDAKLENGVLSLRIPKVASSKAPKAKEIKIS